jgi:hypothetical protein
MSPIYLNILPGMPERRLRDVAAGHHSGDRWGRIFWSQKTLRCGLVVDQTIEGSEIHREHRHDERHENDCDKPERHHQAAVAFSEVGAEERIDRSPLLNATHHDVPQQEQEHHEHPDDRRGHDDCNLHRR